MRIIKIKQQQTVIDFTCQQAGTLEALFEVAAANGISITEAVPAGTFLLVPEVDKKVIAFYENGKLDITTQQREVPVNGGIGYMQIGTSFKVS